MKNLALCFLLLTTALPGLAKPPLGLAQLRTQSVRSLLESPQTYLASVRASGKIFAQQGGVVQLDGSVPSLLLPDLHAQRDYLLAALQMPWQGTPVYTLLQRGQINVVCLGDGMHAEQRAQARWLEAEQDYLQGTHSQALQAEMVESLGLLKMVMDLKVAYPKHFFFVRGNHEDMDPASPYGKFAQVGESNLVKSWVTSNFGAAFLKEWHDCERSMPLIACGGSFVASHAPPEQVLSVAGVQARGASAIRACTWSDNTQWQPGGPQERAFEANCKLFQVTKDRPWLVGHRKVVDALFRSQCGGKLIQINPLDSQPRVFAVAPPKGQAFRPERDIRVLR